MALRKLIPIIVHFHHMDAIMKKHAFILRGKTVAYWTYGNPTMPAVIYIHGFRGNHKGLVGIALEMKRSYVIVPDLPGYGDSEPWESTPHTVLEYASFLQEFCEELGLKKYHVVGHSFGATLAILFAGLYGKHIQKLVLIAPVISQSSIESIIGTLYYQIARVLPPVLQRIYLVNQISDAGANVMLLKSASFHRKAEILVDGLRNIHTLSERIIMENFISLYTTDPFEISKNITAATLIIAGTKDRLSPKKSMEKLREFIPHSVTKYIPKEGHIMPLEAPKTLGNAISRFIESSPT